jgi:protein-S-isoprenylcysteine O-methyltransferase Ste14
MRPSSHTNSVFALTLSDPRGSIFDIVHIMKTDQNGQRRRASPTKGIRPRPPPPHSLSSSSSSPLWYYPPLVYQSCLAGILAGKFWWWPSAPTIFAGMTSSLLPRLVVGLPLLTGGAAIALHNKRTFQYTQTPMMGGRSKDGLSPLHTWGDFKWTRNPMYLGVTVALLGAAILSNNVWTLIFPLLNWIIMDQFYIPLEEVQLEDAFGDEYRQYKQTVRRWL